MPKTPVAAEPIEEESTPYRTSESLEADERVTVLPVGNESDTSTARSADKRKDTRRQIPCK